LPAESDKVFGANQIGKVIRVVGGADVESIGELLCHVPEGCTLIATLREFMLKVRDIH
jgi:hypothetical protein